MTTQYRVRNKDLKQWARLAEDQGWYIEPSGSGHIKWFPPEQLVRERFPDDMPLNYYVLTASTPSTARSLREDIRSLRQAGLMSHAEWRAYQRAQRAVPSREEERVAGTWVCRHSGCPESFSNPNRRDSHESECRFRVVSPPMPSTPEPKPSPPKVRSPHHPTLECAGPEGCGMVITVQNFSRHVEKKHPNCAYVRDGEQAYLARMGSPPEQDEIDRRAERERDPELDRLLAEEEEIERHANLDRLPPMREHLISVVFPDGIPADVGKLTAFTAWLMATDTFLGQIGES